MTDIQYYLLCSILWLLSVHLIKQFFKSSNPLHLLPPSPPSLPIIGHLHHLTSILPTSLQKLSTKYGSLLYLHLGSSHMLLVSSASMATEIFKTQDITFADRPSFAFADELPYGNHGFFAAQYGEYWKFIKKLCMTELFAVKQMELSRSVRSKEIERFLKQMLEKSERKEVIDLGAELVKLTNNNICRTVMSTRCSEKGNEDSKIRELINKTIDLAVKVSFGDVLVGPLKRIAFWLYGRQIIDITLKYDEILENILMEHEERGKREGFDREDRDLIDVLLMVYQDEKADIKLTRIQLKAFLLDIFIGGTNSSSEIMQWTMAELISHPDVCNKVKEEIKAVVGSDRLVTESDVPNLPYLQAVVKETLRLYPSSPVVMRKNRHQCKVQGFDIPVGTTVAVNVYAIMRDPEIWDNPNEFLPDRFLVSSKIQEDQSEIREQNFNFVAFGGGRRRCPGSVLAENIIHTAVAAMIQCFDWKAVDFKVNMQIGAGISLPMAHPLLCLPVVHFNPFASSTYNYLENDASHITQR